MPPAHRNGDSRFCGASTIVEGQSTVFVDGKLWAVKGDPNSHVDGHLKPDHGTSVEIEGKPVIVIGDQTLDVDGQGDGPPEAAAKDGSSDVYAYGD